MTMGKLLEPKAYFSGVAGCDQVGEMPRKAQERP
jgi:hypothetical protein